MLRQGVQAISDLITLPGEINIDFADVRTVMQGQGDAIMGIGSATGDNRAVEAATKAINNPLLEDARIDGARNLLINVTGGEDFSLTEFEEILNLITKSADREYFQKPGLIIDPSLGDEVRVTVIATGFDRERAIREESRSRRSARRRPGEARVRGLSIHRRMEANHRDAGRAARASSTSSGRNDEEELDIPTVLREQKFAGEPRSPTDRNSPARRARPEL